MFQAENNLCRNPKAGLCLACWRDEEGHCGWSRVSEGEREERRMGRGRGRLFRALWTSRGLGLFPGGRWEPWRTVGREGT